ncbi:hypothetical protein A5792_19995 [Mycolicibacterium peregrinum]|uniref:Uncharacterized protein n=1 Tax=Mycolicibacterium peregrinum TaxID=43304 RepID=A0A1A0R3R4_MYCPR|nr:hypothetical protein [Mycolicibacterium peregrinum]OBB29095.1 hypothetical protein A5792_19995 [Mycolicibacterium peregrinum]
MDELLSHKLFGHWTDGHRHRAVLVDTDFAADNETWVEELLTGALAAMANAGVEVTRTPLRNADGRIYLTLDGQETMALDVDNGSLHDGVHGILGRFDAIAAGRGRRERWNVCGDPVGVGYFVTPEELVTPAGVDVRELDIGEPWYRARPD